MPATPGPRFGRPSPSNSTPQQMVPVDYADAAEAVLILEGLAEALRARRTRPGDAIDAKADEVERVAEDLAKPLGQRMHQDRQFVGGQWTRDLHGLLPE